MIHPVFLPPQLPQEDDSAPELDDELVGLIVKSLQDFGSLQGSTIEIDSVFSMACNYQTVHNNFGHITHERLQENLAQLLEDGRSYNTASRYPTESR